MSSSDPAIVRLENKFCEIREELKQVFRESINEQKVVNEKVQNMLQLILQNISSPAPGP